MQSVLCLPGVLSLPGVTLLPGVASLGTVSFPNVTSVPSMVSLQSLISLPRPTPLVPLPSRSPKLHIPPPPLSPSPSPPSCDDKNPTFCQHELTSYADKLAKCKTGPYSEVCRGTCEYCPAPPSPPPPISPSPPAPPSPPPPPDCGSADHVWPCWAKCHRQGDTSAEILACKAADCPAVCPPRPPLPTQPTPPSAPEQLITECARNPNPNLNPNPTVILSQALALTLNLNLTRCVNIWKSRSCRTKKHYCDDTEVLNNCQKTCGACTPPCKDKGASAPETSTLKCIEKKDQCKNKKVSKRCRKTCGKC